MREQGYSTEDEEHHDGMQAIGVPVQYVENPPVLKAVFISGPKSRIKTDVQESLNDIQRTVNVIERRARSPKVVERRYRRYLFSIASARGTTLTAERSATAGAGNAHDERESAPPEWQPHVPRPFVYARCSHLTNKVPALVRLSFRTNVESNVIARKSGEKHGSIHPDSTLVEAIGLNRFPPCSVLHFHYARMGVKSEIHTRIPDHTRRYP